jgi:hypothetical protein
MLSHGCGVPRPATSRLSTVDTLSIKLSSNLRDRQARDAAGPGRGAPDRVNDGKHLVAGAQNVEGREREAYLGPQGRPDQFPGEFSLMRGRREVQRCVAIKRAA